jgi:hypothetical protein
MGIGDWLLHQAKAGTKGWTCLSGEHESLRLTPQPSPSSFLKIFHETISCNPRN